MSFAEIVEEVQKLSLDEQRRLDAVLREAIEDAEDVADAQEVLQNPGRRWTIDEVKTDLGL